MGWIWFLVWLIGYGFAFAEMIRADMAHSKKWGKGYELTVAPCIELYMFLALFSWFAYIIAFILRKDFEGKYAKGEKR